MLFRAWCVAEIVEANVLRIPARITVSSQTLGRTTHLVAAGRSAVDRNYDRLSNLDVRDCFVAEDGDCVVPF